MRAGVKTANASIAFNRGDMMNLPEPHIPERKRVVPDVPPERLAKIKVGRTAFEGKMHHVGYKVVTSDMHSLGLRHNPNILTYLHKEWLILPPEWIEEGGTDWGGFWASRTKSGAKRLREYVKDMHDIDGRIFKAYLGTLLFYNTYRIKTDRIYLGRELFKY